MALTIYPLVAGAVPTVIMDAFTYGVSSQITVESTASIPTPPNHLTLRDEDGYFLTIAYTTVADNVISGISVVEGNSEHTFEVGSSIVRDIDKYDFDVITDNFTNTNSMLTNHTTNLSNPHSVTKAQVGLENVDNTSDLNKPVSTATSAALSLKVDKVEGKSLTSNDYTNTDKAIVNGVSAQLATKVDKATGYSLVQDSKILSYDSHLANTSNPHSVTKSQIGLNNVDNTSDLSKPVSTATQTALNGKVDKVTGKSLSTNDFTTTEKTKLAGIADGAEVNVNADWNAVSGDSFILNKPAKLPNPQTITFTGASTGVYDGSTALTINIPSSGGGTAIWGNIGGTLSNQTDLNTALSAKQNTIDATHKVSADLIADTTTTNKFVTSAEKATWNGKQNALTFDNVPTEYSVNPVKSGGVYSAIQTVQSAVTTKVSDVKLNGTSVVSNNVASINTVDNLTSTSQSPLSANQGKVLNDRIEAISSIGRYLALWNCVTGLPTTNPPTLPYAYKSGDYYIISNVGATNYTPTGSSYTGAASTTITTENPHARDIWRYDGTNWYLETNQPSTGVSDVTVGGTSVVSGNTAVIPLANASHTGALSATDWSTFNNKQNALTIEQSPSTSTTAVVSSNGVRTALSAKQDTLTAGTNITINSGTISVTGSSTPVSAGTTLFTTGGAYTELDKKVDKVSGKGLSENDYTTAEKNKLAGIANGAEVNVNADWNAVSGDAQILNKPTSMTPTIHASTHATGGTDAITPSSIGAQSAITSASKLSSDLVSDSGATNKFVSAIEKATWSGKQDTMSGGTNVSITGGTTINVAGDANAPTANGTTLATTGNLYQRIRYGTSAQRTASSPRTGDVWIEIS